MNRIIGRLAHSMALLGGCVLTFLIAVTCVSVAGRALNAALHGSVKSISPEFANWALALGVGPINGDFELVEAGVAFAVFAFLPLCQLTSGHAVVDIFTAALPQKGKQFLAMIIDSVFAAVLILITVQLFGGTLSKYRFGETTFLLQFPVWWSYAASFAAALVASLVGVYVATMRLSQFVTGKTGLVGAEETEH